MTSKTPQACWKATCLAPAERGTRACPMHRRGQRHRTPVHGIGRGTSGERGYNYAWQKLSKWKLKKSPWCVDCIREGKACPRMATEVHHVVALRDGGRRMDEANLESLCKFHHTRKSIAEQKRRVGGVAS